MASTHAPCIPRNILKFHEESVETNGLSVESIWDLEEGIKF